MAQIPPELFKKLQSRLGLSRPAVYLRISQKLGEGYLERHLAALALAAENGISITKYATPEDLAALRGHNQHRAVGHVTVAHPTPAAPAPPARVQQRKTNGGKKVQRKVKDVWVVHGRNMALKKSMFQLLRAFGLNPMEWTIALRDSKKGSPHISDILEAAFKKAGAVVVLLTPDDEVVLKPELRQQDDDDYESKPTGQARPNVLFEAGMAFGSHADATVLVTVGKLRPFSNVAGRHMVKLSNSTASRQELATKLQNAGCDVELGGTDWHTEGDFRV